MEALAKQYPQIADLIFQFWVHLVILLSAGFLGRKPIKRALTWPLRVVRNRMTRKVQWGLDALEGRYDRLRQDNLNILQGADLAIERDARRTLDIASLRREVEVITRFLLNQDNNDDLIVDQSYDAENGNSGTFLVLKGRPAREYRTSQSSVPSVKVTGNAPVTSGNTLASSFVKTKKGRDKT